MFDASVGKGLRQWVGREGLIGEPFYRSSEYSFETVKRLEEGFSAWLCWLFRDPVSAFLLLDFHCLYYFEKHHIIVTCKCTSIVGQYHKSSISGQ